MSDKEQRDRWMSVDEIADYVGVSKDTVYAWINDRGMPAHRIVRLWKFKRDEVDRWLKKRTRADSSSERGPTQGGRT